MACRQQRRRRATLDHSPSRRTIRSGSVPTSSSRNNWPAIRHTSSALGTSRPLTWTRRSGLAFRLLGRTTDRELKVELILTSRQGIRVGSRPHCLQERENCFRHQKPRSIVTVSSQRIDCSLEYGRECRAENVHGNNRHGGSTAPRRTVTVMQFIVWQEGGRKQAGRSEPKLLGDVEAERLCNEWSGADSSMRSARARSWARANRSENQRISVGAILNGRLRPR